MSKKTIIIGGAGFIGYHCAVRALREGHDVTLVDNLSRQGAAVNLASLRELAGAVKVPLRFCHADIRHHEDLARIFREVRPELVIHQAAQVAVTTSVTNPRLDFEVNALGTFNVLEAVRLQAPEAYVVFSSTNKVYGGMEDVAVVEEATRYRYRDHPEGFDETRATDFHSPYGCSKGAADQYVRDYCRIFGLRAAVFRQSCIYGPNQFGIEDQGWVAWFAIAAVLNRPVTIYGTGKQVRDLLWVDDLCEAYWLAWRQGKGGEIYNMGGGAENTLSLLELVELLRRNGVSGLNPGYSTPRPGDQPVYVTNAAKARAVLSWRPKVAPGAGVVKLLGWVRENQALIKSVMNFS
jgi:CDP-paratose 2-epimerase